MFVLVGIANLVDNEILGQGNILRNAVVFFYLSAEGVSILEHAGHIGLPIPQKLHDILKELQAKGHEQDKTNLDEEDNTSK